MKRPELLVLALALLAALAKGYCAATTGGTFDVVCFREFGRLISDEGLIALYQKVRIFNHTPLVGTFASLAYDFAAGREQLFAFLIRLPGILADLISVGALLWLRRRTGNPPWWALLLFAVSPVAFMISGYHGNIDSVLACALLLTVLACVSKDAAVSALLLGLSCQVKIVPLFVAPALFFYWCHRRQGLRFFTIATATILTGWAWPLCTIPTVFLHQVIGYGSMWGTWGIGALLHFSGMPGMEAIKTHAASSWVSEALKLALIGWALLLAWRRRAGDAQDLIVTFSLTWLGFFVLAPGFGVQYLAWFTPFLLLHSARWYAVVTAGCSVGLFAFYTIVAGGLPWDSAYPVLKTAPQWIPWLLVPWASLLVSLWALRSDWLRPPVARRRMEHSAADSPPEMAFAPRT